MPRALEDPGKSQGPIRVPSGDADKRVRRTRRRPDPCLSGAQRSTQAAANQARYYVVYGRSRLHPRPPPERVNVHALCRGTFQYNNVLVQTVKREVRIEKASLQHTYQLPVRITIQKTLWRLQ